MEHETAPTVEVIRLGQLAIRYLQHAGGGCDMGMFELTVPPGATAEAPEGYELVIGAVDTFALSPALRKQPPYDPINDFVPAGLELAVVREQAFRLEPELVVVGPRPRLAFVTKLEIAPVPAAFGLIQHGVREDAVVHHRPHAGDVLE